MAKSIEASAEQILKYQALTDVMGLLDLDIVGQEKDKDEQEVILFCVPRWPIDCCPRCGQLTSKIHDYPEQRTIHDAPLRGMKTLLVFDVHRLDCVWCGQKFTQRVRDVVPDCTYTHRLASLIGNPEQKQSVQTLSDVYGVGYKVAESIIRKAGEAKLSERKENKIEVRRLGIDEQSNRKGQGNYVLVLTDLERRIVLDILPDRRKSTLKAWLNNPGAGVNLDKLESVAIDLWRPYRDAVDDVFGEQVQIVADRFHVMQNLHQAIHEARKSEQKACKDENDRKELKGLRYLLLKKDENLTDKEKVRIDNLKETYPNLHTLTRLRQRLYDWYENPNTTTNEATDTLEMWVTDALKTGYESVAKFCQTIANWRPEIVAFFYIESQVDLLKV